MLQTNKKQRLAGFVMLSMTAIFWGAGFVLNDNLLRAAFYNTPNLINTARFGLAAVILAAIFARKLKFGLNVLLYAGVGGALLFGGFTLQLLGLRLSTPSHNGFYTAAYLVFVPFTTWILCKTRPKWYTFVGVAVALTGLAILNADGFKNNTRSTLLGDALTLAGALLFAIQITWTDYAYSKKKIDCPNMTFWQVLFAAVLFALYSVIFESKHYASITFDAGYCIWRLAVVTLLGTAFAYFAQSYAQTKMDPAETSIVLACESPIGAVLSVALGIEAFVWNLAVGGALIFAAVIIIELPPYVFARKNKRLHGDAALDDKNA